MIYKKYGEVFKKIRKQKGLPLTSFEVLGISKAALGKFECGKSMLGFDRLTIALQYLGVSLEEYELHLNKFVTSELQTYSDNIFNAYITENQKQLRALGKELKHSEYPFLSISTQICLQQLKSKSIESCKEFEQVRDFLYNQQMWGYYELSILFHVLFYLKSKDILCLVGLCLESHNFLNVPKYRNKVIELSYRAVAILISKNEKELSCFLLDKVKSTKIKHTMVNKNFFNLIDGYWNYKFGDAPKGEKKMKNSIRLIKELESPDMANYISKLYKLIVTTN